MSSRKFVRVEQWGMWTRARDTLSWLEKGSKDDVQEEIRQEMEDTVEILKMEIESQSIPMAPLNEKYAKYKATHGLDPRVLIATGDYLDSFTVKRVGKSTWQIIADGYEELAEWLEYGTEDMPPRPHWVYASAELETSLIERVRKLFKEKGGFR